MPFLLYHPVSMFCNFSETKGRREDACGVVAHISFGTLCRPGHQFYFCHEYISYTIVIQGIYGRRIYYVQAYLMCVVVFFFLYRYIIHLFSSGRTNLKKSSVQVTENTHLRIYVVEWNNKKKLPSNISRHLSWSEKRLFSPSNSTIELLCVFLDFFIF